MTLKTAGVALVTSLLALCWGAARAAEGAARAVVVLDFEGPADRRLVRSRKRTELAADAASRGRSSLKVQPGDYLNIRTPRLGKSRKGDLLRIDLFNSAKTPLEVRAELFDDTSSRGYWYRHVREYTLRPGWNTLTFRVARLRRGEKNSQRVKDSFLDPARLGRIDLAFGRTRGPAFICLDNVRFEQDTALPAVKGLRAFDFGPANQSRRPGFTASSREVYNRRRGYGWSSAAWPRAVRNYTHPNDLLADFREARGETFSVDLPNGAYHVRVYYEDHGWWEDQFALFTWRTIKAEGRQVFEERLTREAAARRFYRFADTEPRPGMNVYDTYIRNGRFKPKEFDVTVADGRLDLRFDADRPMACRIAALVLWPASEAAAAAKWCAELERRLEQEFNAENVYVDTAPRGRRMADLPETAGKAGLVIFSAGRTRATPPSYVPAKGQLLAALELFCVPGEDTGAAFSLRPVKDGGAVSVGAALGGLKPAVYLVQNRLSRWRGQYTIRPDILRRAGDEELRDGETRQFWLEVPVPPGTKPGKYAGELRVALRGNERAVPLTVEVLPVVLSEPRMPFGVFGLMPDYYAPPGVLGEVLGLLRRHGMSSVSGVPLGDVRAVGSAVKVSFRRADEVMKVVREAGFRLPVDTYGGGFRGVGAAAGKLRQPRSAVLRLAFAQLRDHAKATGWPPVNYSMVDEPHWSDDAVTKAANKVEAVHAAAPWLLTNGYWSPRAANASHRRLMDALGRTSMGRVTREAVAYLKSKGRGIGFYGGTTRHEFGLRQWAADAEGFHAHYAWHFHVRYGDPYYDLDAREPDVCMVYYTPTEVRPSLRLKDVRAGAYDYRYLRTLADLVAKAKPGPAVAEAKALLDKAKAAGNLYRDKGAPRIADPDAFRRKVAEAIMKNQRPTSDVRRSTSK